MSTREIDENVAMSRNATVGGNVTVRGSARVGHNLKVDGYLDAPNIKGMYKGLFTSQESLKESYPKPEQGWVAFVGTTLPADMWLVNEDGEWYNTGKKGGSPTLDGSDVLNQALEEAKTAKETSEAAKKTADDASATAKAAKNAADEARSQASSALDLAGQALTSAEGARGTANAAKNAADDAKSKVDELEETLSEVEGNLTDQIDGAVANIGIYPFDGVLNNKSEASAPGIYFIKGESCFFYKAESGKPELLLDNYNNTNGKALTDRLYRYRGVLYHIAVALLPTASSSLSLT